MPNILSFCINDAACFVALGANDQIFEASVSVTPNITHATALVPAIQSLWHAHGKPHLDVISTTRGPGSFTSVRITLSVANGFMVAFPKAQVYAPSSFQILRALCTSEHLLTLIDSKRGSFFVQEWHGSKTHLTPYEANRADLPKDIPYVADIDINGATEKKDINPACLLIELYGQQKSKLDPKDTHFEADYFFTPEYKKAKSLMRNA